MKTTRRKSRPGNLTLVLNLSFLTPSLRLNGSSYENWLIVDPRASECKNSPWESPGLQMFCL